MISYSEDFLYDLLLDRFDYKVEDAKVTVKELMNLSDEGKEILKEYLETGFLPCIEKNGLSLQVMRTQVSYEMTDVALILIFDGIQKNMRDYKEEK